MKWLSALLSRIFNVPPDPIHFCEVYKAEGCAHVDGFLCDERDKLLAEREEREPVAKVSALELDTAMEITGFFYAENGYYMREGKPDLERPVTRYYIVDADGIHHEIAEDTIKHYARPVPAVPEGMVLVPKVLTPEIGDAMKSCESGEYSLKEAWDLILAAAPHHDKPANGRSMLAATQNGKEKG